MKKLLMFLVALLLLTTLAFGQTFSLTRSDSIATVTGLSGYYTYSYAYVKTTTQDTMYFQSLTPFGTWVDLTVINLSLNEIVLAGRPVIIPANMTYCIASYELYLYGIRIIRKNVLNVPVTTVQFKHAGR